MAGKPDYDVVVIGSGFGGAVTACRLAEAGYTVLVLERGHRWGPTKGRRDEGNERGDAADDEVVAFPRESCDMWIWDDKHPERRSGWIDFRKFPHMGVVQGSGVGGGSLIYANVSIDPDPALFDAGWPGEITWQELRRYYHMVGHMLELGQVPAGQRSNRVKLLKEAADRNGWTDRFRPLDLAVRFDPRLTYDSSQRPDRGRSTRGRNIHGAWQGACVHLGNCDFGCDVGARNTLDKNYLFVAEEKGARVWPRRLVRSIAQEGDGYRVHFDRIGAGGFEAGSVSGRLVIVAAGSLGSTELLLRCRDQYRTLPQLSRVLGRNWSSNGDFLTVAFHFFRRTLFPGRGVVFSGALRFLDGPPDAAGTRPGQGPRYNIEDGGFPYQAVGPLIANIARNRSSKPGLRHKLFHLGLKLIAAYYHTIHWLSQRPWLRAVQPVFERLDPVNHMMPWVAQGQDAADGILSLKNGELSLDWPAENSRRLIDAIYATHKKVARSAWGLVLPSIGWTWFRSLITPHPLGGCSMGENVERGVVNHKGEVFGYPRLYVADGAIVPEAIGVNPSKTIAALAERIAEHIIKDHPRDAA